MLGDMLFSRAGVRVRGGGGEIICKDVAESSTLSRCEGLTCRLCRRRFSPRRTGMTLRRRGASDRASPRGFVLSSILP
jgi:hypothetical protein